MANWAVWVFVKESGKCPFDKWKNSTAVTKRDEAALDAKIMTIEAWSGPQLQPEVLKDYRGTNLKELKVRGDKKQLRPLCIVDEDRKIIVLCGAIEKGGATPDGDIKTGENLRKEYLSGKGKLRSYFQD